MKAHTKTYTLFLFFLLSACSSTSVTKNNRFEIFDNYIVDNKLTSLTSVNTFRFQGWNSLDPKHLIVSSNQKKAYLLTLTNYCNNLDVAHNIRIQQSLSSRLSTKFDYIIIPGQAGQQCKIKSIHQINKQQRNELTALRKSSK